MLLQDIRDDLDLMTPPEPNPIWLIAGCVAAGVALLALGWWILRRRRRRRRGARKESPEQAAWTRLAALPGLEGRALYAELSRVMSEYVTARHGVGAEHLTSMEIRAELRRRGAYGGEAQTVVEGFLELCDRGKFAPRTDADAAEGAVAACREAIRQLSLATLTASQLATVREGEANAA